MLCFGLHVSALDPGGNEHRNLMREQFSIDIDSVGRHLRFIGRSSKIVQGGLKQQQVQTKDLKIYAKPSVGERCVDVFSTYMALIPASGPFYRRPIKGSAAPPCFSLQVVGKNTLKTVFKRFCAQAGFIGNFTNHSGKVTCATNMFSQTFMNN